MKKKTTKSQKFWMVTWEADIGESTMIFRELYESLGEAKASCRCCKRVSYKPVIVTPDKTKARKR